MRFDWWTLALQTINALVLIWLLGRFLFRPVADMIAERKAAAARLLQEAETAKAAAFASEKDAAKARDEIAATRADAMATAIADAQTQIGALLDAARAEAQHVREAARAEIARDAVTAREAQMKRASGLAVDISKRLMARLPSSALIAGFIEGLSTVAASTPPEIKAGFDRDGGARLKTPRSLTPEEETECRQALAHAFGRPLNFSVEIDPALVAGLELENAHTAIRNSLRADLEQIVAALGKSDSDDANRSAP